MKNQEFVKTICLATKFGLLDDERVSLLPYPRVCATRATAPRQPLPFPSHTPLSLPSWLTPGGFFLSLPSLPTSKSSLYARVNSFAWLMDPPSMTIRCPLQGSQEKGRKRN